MVTEARVFSTLQPEQAARETTPPRRCRGRRHRTRSSDTQRSRAKSADQVTCSTGDSISNLSELQSDWSLNRTSHSHPGALSPSSRSSFHRSSSAHRSQGRPHRLHSPPSTDSPSAHHHGTITSNHRHHHHKHYHSDDHLHHHHRPLDPDPPPPRRRRRSRHRQNGSQSSLPSSADSERTRTYSCSSCASRSRSCSSVPGGCRRETLNVSLCGCGFLGVYHLGAVSCLLKHGPSFLGSVDRVAGASAGALAAALLVTNPTLNAVETATEMATALAKTIRRKPLGAITPGYRMARDVEQMLDRILPPDAHEVARGKLHVSLTDVKTKENVIMSEFDSRQELIETLVASCHIPVYSGGECPEVKGKHYCDGGMTNNLFCFKDGRTITVSPFSGRQDIGPRDNLKKGTRGTYISFLKQDMQLNVNNIRRVSHAFFPPRTSILQQYWELGHKDASRFLVREGAYEITKPPDKPPMVYESSV